MRSHALNASALYRFLLNEPGAEVVAGLFKRARDADATLMISVINWGEVYYGIARRRGLRVAQEIMAQVRHLPLRVINADEPITEAAARLKSGHGLPYADCFAAVIAGKTNVLVTADVKDFKRIRWLKILALPPHTQ